MSQMIDVSIAENLQAVLYRMAKAALRAGRSAEEIALVAVSKKQGIDKIRAAMAAGALIFGENYVQEAQEKIPSLGYQGQWHLIGHLQKNKIKQAVKLFSLIHTVDSLEQAQLINQQAQQEGKIQSILIQVKLAEEETKSGLDPEETGKLIEQILKFPNLNLEGLMTMPPFFPEPDEVRPYFRQLRELRDYLNKHLKSLVRPLQHLSMGMSHDFEVAIEEGATLVRVGSAIFGDREY